MPITSLIVSVDKDEYSKYEKDRSIITAKLTATSDTGGGETEDVTVALMKARRDRNVSVGSMSTTLTFPGAPGDSVTSTVSLDLNSFVEDGTDPLNQGRLTAPFSKIHRGYYFVKATSDLNPATTNSTADFPISIVTLERWRRDFLFGMELSSFEIRKPKNQPVFIGGVEITETSRHHDIGFFPLTFNAVGTSPVSRTLSWASGPMIQITGPGNYTLPSKNKDNYIIVRVESLDLLPTEHQVDDDIIIDKDIMDEQTLREYLDRAVDYFENLVVQVKLEPTHVLSDAAGLLGSIFDASDYDINGSPLTLYPRATGRWLEVQIPFQSLLMIRKLVGAINKHTVLEISPEWVEMSEKSGLVQLVPFSRDYEFQFIGLVWIDTLRRNVELPNFWHYDAFVGLRDIPGDLIEGIAMKAALGLMAIAGQAFKSVLSGQNVGRDGVYESVSYFNQGRGLYGSIIQQYQDTLDATEQKYRNYYRGPNMVVA